MFKINSLYNFLLPTAALLVLAGTVQAQGGANYFNRTIHYIVGDTEQYTAFIKAELENGARR